MTKINFGKCPILTKKVIDDFNSKVVCNFNFEVYETCTKLGDVKYEDKLTDMIVERIDKEIPICKICNTLYKKHTLRQFNQCNDKYFKKFRGDVFV